MLCEKHCWSHTGNPWEVSTILGMCWEVLPGCWVNVAVAECVAGCWGAGLRFEDVPGCVAGEPGQCLRVCWVVLPGCWVKIWGVSSDILPGCRVNVLGAAGKLVELCREDARNGWGYVGNPQFGAARLGQAHAQRSKSKSFSFFFTLLISD